MRWMKNLAFHLNIFAQCRRLGVPFWSCPQFLFLIMGIINIAAILAVYTIAQEYASPELLVAILIGLSVFLFIVSFVIIGAFEHVVEARQREAFHHREVVTMKDQFVFVAAHELRTPANAIRWVLESLELKKSPFLEKEKDAFKVLETSSSKLLELVRDLLEVSRIETGAIAVHLEPTMLGDALQESIKSLAVYAEKSNITIVNNIPENLPPVFADKIRLKEVFDNLLTNAIKYNKEHGEVVISAERAAGGVSVHIQDQGKGIVPEEQQHIFEKFWRSVDVHAIEGTGLGLFIVHKLVTLMRGRISFSSEPGLGTVFSVHLPTL